MMLRFQDQRTTLSTRFNACTHSHPPPTHTRTSQPPQVMDFLGSAAFSQAVQALDVATGALVCLKIIKNNKDYFDQSLDEIKLLRWVGFGLGGPSWEMDARVACVSMQRLSILPPSSPLTPPHHQSFDPILPPINQTPPHPTPPFQSATSTATTRPTSTTSCGCTTFSTTRWGRGGRRPVGWLVGWVIT